MKTIRIFLSESFQFLVVKFSSYLNRHVFVMNQSLSTNKASDAILEHTRSNPSLLFSTGAGPG